MYSVCGVTRFVVDCETLLRIAAGEIEVAADHTLLAPTLVRSQALATLYEAARRSEISAAEGIERVTRINSLKVRFLGDKVLQRTAWKVADHLEWETTFDAEFVALTQLQASSKPRRSTRCARPESGSDTNHLAWPSVKTSQTRVRQRSGTTPERGTCIDGSPAADHRNNDHERGGCGTLGRCTLRPSQMRLGSGAPPR